MRVTGPLRALRLGRVPLAALAVGLVATVGGFFLARTWVENSERAALEDHAASTATLIGSFARQIEALLYAGSVVVEATDGSPGTFESTVGQRVAGTAISSATLLRRRPDGTFGPAAAAGGPSRLLARLTPAEERRLDAIARSPGEIRLVKVDVVDGTRVVSFATAGDPSGEFVIYGESVIPSLERLFVVRFPKGLQYALYTKTPEPGILLQASTETAIEGDTVVTELPFGSETAVLVVGGTPELVGTLMRATPWLVLGGGALVSLALAVMLELSRRRLISLAAQRELAAQNAQLRELDRLKDELVATVSHELRTPLTSILGYLELIREEPDALSDEHRGYLEVIDRNARRLLQLVSDLLFVARIDAGRLELDVSQVDLADVVRECLEAQRVPAEQAGVSLRLVEEPVPPITGDRGRLAQLTDNLVSNAIKFTPAGGSVEVRVRPEGANVVLEVADTGIGIPADEIDRLFERFFRSSIATERAVQGTGLGLTIAKAIVEAHRGRISVESVEGEGSVFRVELPVDERVQSEAERSPSAVAGTRG